MILVIEAGFKAQQPLTTIGGGSTGVEVAQILRDLGIADALVS